jgi:hypothetical protein
MPTNWTQPEPGRYESVQPDGCTIIEHRTVTEAFRQGELLSSARLPAPDSAPAFQSAIEKAARSAPKKATKRKPEPTAKPKARKQ